MLYLVLDETSHILSTETELTEATKYARKYRDTHNKVCAVFKAIEIAVFNPTSYPERRPLGY